MIDDKTYSDLMEDGALHLRQDRRKIHWNNRRMVCNQRKPIILIERCYEGLVCC